MKYFYLMILFMFISTIVKAQTPSWAWAKSAGGNSYDNGSSTSVDLSGNIYVVGTFNSSSIQFGNTILTNPNATISNGAPDMYIVKYDAKGSILWARNAGGGSGASMSEGNSVTTDINGNVYVTGHIVNFLVFGQDTTYGSGMFLAKFDTNGNILWTKSAGSGFFNSATSVTTDVTGNVFVAGFFMDSTITFETTTLTNDSSGTSNLFIVKYDSGGNVIWANSAKGKLSDEARSVSTDASGNVLLSGSFYSDSLKFGTNILINDSAGNADIFIVKYDQNGNVLWAKSEGGKFSDGCNSIISDANSNVYITGYFQDSVTIGTISICGGMFLIKYDPNGNNVWARGATGTWGGGNGNSLDNDPSGNICITGTYNYNITFDTLHLISAAGNEMFIVKYNPNGNVLWAKDSYGGSDASSVAIDIFGNIYVTGSFNVPSITFDYSTIYSNWSSDMFLAKISKCGSPQYIEICLVSVDTATSTKNYIIWEKPVGVPIDSFRVYRQISSQYVHIGSVPYSALSEFVDTTNGINPKLTSYKYKISIVDTCGDEGPLSIYHQSMHFLVSPAIPSGFNLFWNDYVGFNFNQYIIWRDGNNTGNWQKLDSVSYGITTYTDITPPSDSARYWIEAVNPEGCNPTKAGGHNSSRSNVQRNFAVISAPLLSADNPNITISPNPTQGKFALQISDANTSIINSKISISNIQGKIVYQTNIFDSKSEIDLSSEPCGIYILTVKSDERIYHQKLVKE